MLPNGPPTKPLPSKAANKGNAGGRKIRDGIASSISPVTNVSLTAEKKPKKKRGGTTMEELDRMLENDHVALLSMKKDITIAQKNEISKSIKSLLELQKEHDIYAIGNAIKEKELVDTLDSIKQLQELGNVVQNVNVEINSEFDELRADLVQVNATTETEQRTFQMLTLISKRLQDEISDCRVETAKTQFGLNQSKHELDACESTLRLSRQEMVVQEKQVENLSRVMKSRKEERLSKMKQLKNIINDGETSVNLVKQISAVAIHNSSIINGKFNETYENSSPREHSDGSIDLGSNKAAANFTLANSASLLNLISTTNGGVLPQNLNASTSLNASLDMSNSSNPIAFVPSHAVNNTVKEILTRYQSKEERIEALHQFAEDLNVEIKKQQLKKKLLIDQISLTSAASPSASAVANSSGGGSINASASTTNLINSNRLMYQEVELKDHALNTARKEHEEWKMKEYRLRVNIESLKRCLPRFLTKVTKVVHPMPSVEQLPDAVHKLEDEIAKLIKYIGTAIIKDSVSNGDDTGSLALGGGAMLSSSMTSGNSSSTDVNSEIGRIRKLPGYRRLQKQVFINLMSAKQDITDRNIRIASHAYQDRTVRTAGAGGMGLYLGYHRPESTSGGDHPVLNFGGTLNTLVNSNDGNPDGDGKGFGAESNAISNNRPLSSTLNTANTNDTDTSTNATTTTSKDGSRRIHLHSNIPMSANEDLIDSTTIKNISKLLVEKNVYSGGGNNSAGSNKGFRRGRQLTTVIVNNGVNANTVI